MPSKEERAQAKIHGWEALAKAKLKTVSNEKLLKVRVMAVNECRLQALGWIDTEIAARKAAGTMPK